MCVFAGVKNGDSGSVTPFGEKLRDLRRVQGMKQSDFAEKMGVSAAYVSALEHGHKGAPSFDFVQKVVQLFGLIWDDAEALYDAAALSKPKISIDTAGLDPKATRLVNILSGSIHRLDDRKLNAILAILSERPTR